MKREEITASETLTLAGIVQSGARQRPLAEILDRSSRAAMGFLAMGVEPGDAIALLLRNDLPFLEVILAANSIGAYWVPVNWHSKPDEVRYILSDSRATHLVIHSDLLCDVRDAIPAGVVVLCVPTPPEIRAEYSISTEAGCPDLGLAWDSWLEQYAPLPERQRHTYGSMVYTSGTTGRPKGVKRDAVPPERREAYAELRRQWFGHRPGMRTAIVGPLYHSVQASYAMAAFSADATILLLPRFDAEQVLGLIETERLTHLHLVPTMMNRLLQLPDAVRERYDLSSLEFVIHGAAPCPPEVKRRFIEWWGPILHEYYGTSEAGMVSRCNSDEWLEREGTVGKPWPGRTIRIYNDDGVVLPPYAEGEVYMSLGSMPNFTYHNADDKRRDIERDGFVTNGDLGYVDEDGYLFLCDRKVDMVISGGANIYPAEIEAVLAMHPGVADSAVFGVPDSQFGEAMIALVQPREGEALSAAELSSFLEARIAKYKVPREIHIRQTLLRDDSGKNFKRQMREPYWAATKRRI
jgi:long-chain acyl-CoA synthetase